MTILERWKQPTGYLKLPTLDSHIKHAAVTPWIAFVLLMCGVDLESSAWIAFVFGFLWEVGGKILGETWRSCVSDLSQFWLYSPFVLMHYGNWLLAIIWGLILIGVYYYTATRD